MKKILFLLILSVGFYSLIGMKQETIIHAKNRRLNVVTTVGQINDIVKIIAGDYLNVTGLMGPGVDPHLYKASESDVRKIAQADIIFYNGLMLEAKMENIFHKMSRQKKVVALGEAVPVSHRLESEKYKGHYDPHIWFDVLLWKMVAQKIADTLIEVDPVHAADYRERANQYLKRLDELHVYVAKKVLEVEENQRVLVTAHDAFRYFGRKYGFEVIGLQGVSTESQAGTADVIRLADFITERKIRSIFVESSVPERNVKAVVEAVNAKGWSVTIGGELFSDAMGDDGTFEGTYIGMVTHNIDTIVSGLKE